MASAFGHLNIAHRHKTYLFDDGGAGMRVDAGRMGSELQDLRNDGLHGTWEVCINYCQVGRSRIGLAITRRTYSGVGEGFTIRY